MNARVGKLLRWGVALTLVAVLAGVLDLGAILHRLANVNLVLAVPAVLGLVGVHLLGVLSWRRLTSELAGFRMAWGSAIRLYYAAQAIGTVTPGNVGADVYRVAALRRSPHPDPDLAGHVRSDLARFAAPVIIQRLTSILALVCLGLGGAALLPVGAGGLFTPLVIGAGLLACSGLVAMSSPRAVELPVLGRMLARLYPAGATGSARGRLRVALRDGFALGVAFHAVSLVLGFVLVGAVDPATAARPMEVLGALAIARLSLAVPISPNGIGIQEGLLTLLFVQLGLPPDTAIAAALLNRLALLVTAGIGTLEMLAGAKGRALVVARPT